MKSRAAVVLLAALTASCAAPLMRLPSGPGTPLTSRDAEEALAGAAAPLCAAQAMTAEIGVSGTAADHRLRGRLLAGIWFDVRLEAVAPFGQPLFVFVTRGGRATLLLPRDGRVLEDEEPSLVLAAVAGIPLTTGDLHAVLTACPRSYTAVSGSAHGGDWRVVRASGPEGARTVYLRREKDVRWRIAAMASDAGRWRADYSGFAGVFPRTIRLSSVGAAGRERFDLTLKLSQVDMSTELDPAVFTLRIPADAVPITLEELRQSGPLAPQSRG